jgi:hypothetical protein
MATTSIRLKGHKLTTSWGGCEDTYARGTCECGWVFKGWSERMGEVRKAHQSHLQAQAHDNHVRVAYRRHLDSLPDAPWRRIAQRACS